MPSPRSSRSRSARTNPSVVDCDGLEPRDAVGRGGLAEQVAPRRERAASDAAAQLVQLGDAEAVRVLDHHHRRVGDVDADLDHRRRHQHVHLAAPEPVHADSLSAGRSWPCRSARRSPASGPLSQPLVLGHRRGRLEAASAVAEYERLREGPLHDLRLGLLHGQLKSAEKESVMDRFRPRSVDVLVATTVIEVGVDVADATVMVIEDAYRFGIAQLHQLRGRVGRSTLASWCYLLGEPTTTDGTARLEAVAALERRLRARRDRPRAARRGHDPRREPAGPQRPATREALKRDRGGPRASRRELAEECPRRRDARARAEHRRARERSSAVFLDDEEAPAWLFKS